MFRDTSIDPINFKDPQAVGAILNRISSNMSSRKYDNVVVFGPTGTVGGITAFEAHKRGAKVWLAMRDPSKTIDGIPSDVEKSGNFTRVKADLTDPASVTKVIEKSGAKAVYIYLIFGSPDFSRGSLQAMRDAGVEYVVFLSSYSVKPDMDLRQIPKEDFIPFAHAQVEIAVEEIGFPYFTTLRPALFATNYLKNFLDASTKPPRAQYIREEGLGDNIAPDDVGGVAGKVLVDRPSDDAKEVIYLCGPELITAKKSWELVKKITGRSDIDTTPMSKEQYVQSLTAKGMPPSIVNYLAKAMAGREDPNDLYPEALYREGATNTQKYIGRDGTKFADFLEAQKADWQAL